MMGQENEKRGVNMRRFEQSIFSDTERNILLGLSILPRFKCSDLLSGFRMATRVLFRRTSKFGPGKDDLDGKTRVKIDFASSGYISLIHNRNDMLISIPGTLAYRDDAQIRSRIEGAFNKLSGEQCKTSSFVRVAEKLCAQSCCRSMMLKGYLYLCEMVFQKSYEGISLWHSGEKVKVLRDLSQFTLLGMVDTFSVLVNVDCLSVGEVALMSLLCCSYPCVKFGAADTIYNSFLIPAESAAILVGKEKDINLNFDIRSPDLLYVTLIQLACRLGCLEQLREVIQDFRGVPYYLHNIHHVCNFSHVHMLNYRKSNSLVLAFPDYKECRDQVTIPSNYLATTACIISDNLFGQAMVSSFFTYGEHIGAFGMFGCPTGDPAVDPLILTHHCEMGVDHQNYRYNALQKELYLIRGREMPVALLRVRAICNAYFRRIRDSKTVSGMFSPCLLLDIPVSNFHNTTWGICRGFSCGNISLCVPANVYDCARRRAFAWVNGKTEIVPMVGLNILGSKDPIELTTREMAWFANTFGEYRVINMVRTTSSKVTSSYDRMEDMPPFLFQVPFRGCKTIMIFTTGNIMTMLREENPEVLEEAAYQNAGYESFGRKGPRGFSNILGDNRDSLLRIDGPNDEVTINVKSKPQEVGLTGNEGFGHNDEDGVRKGGLSSIVGPPGNRFNNPFGRALKIDLRTRKYLEYSNSWYASDRKLPGIQAPNHGNRFGMKLVGSKGYLSSYEDDNNANDLVGVPCYVVQTPGDGHCGLWALLFDFCLRGRIDMDGYREFVDEIEHASDELGWHRGCDLFLAVGKCNVGLMIYHDATGVHGRKYFWVETFGVKDAGHVIRLISKELVDDNGSCQGLHYELLVPCEGGNFIIPALSNTVHPRSDCTPEEEYRKQEPEREYQLPNFKLIKSRGHRTGPVNYASSPTNRKSGSVVKNGSSAGNNRRPSDKPGGDGRKPGDDQGPGSRGGGAGFPKGTAEDCARDESRPRYGTGEKMKETYSFSKPWRNKGSSFEGPRSERRKWGGSFVGREDPEFSANAEPGVGGHRFKKKKKTIPDSQDADEDSLGSDEDVDGVKNVDPRRKRKSESEGDMYDPFRTKNGDKRRPSFIG